MRYLIILLGFTLFASCTTEEEATKSVGYFDLEKYNQELVDLIKVRSSVIKTVKLNEEIEIQTIENYNMSPELAMMNKYNINKPSLAGKYDVKEDGENTTYTANEEDLITRVLTITKKNNEVTKIEINGLQKSILSESKQTILFTPETSFLLISEDKNKYNKDLKKEVLIEY
jgi:hypothetical protein